MAAGMKQSFLPVTDADTRVLILGSLPGERSLAEQRYYAHPQNQFWQLLSGVVDRDLGAMEYDRRLATLLACHIGLWDVVAAAHRIGSTDAAIREPLPNDLRLLIEGLPALRAVAFNGGTALKLGQRQLGVLNNVEVVALPSSSALHTVGLQAKQPMWDRLKRFLAQ